MAMQQHGVKRSRLSAQAAEAKRQKEVSKIEAYTSLQDDVLQRKRNKDYSLEAFGRTTSLLDLNPEFYTVWNYRRHILLKGLFPASTAEEIVKLLTADLRLTTAYLQVHPKVYWIWSHRKWCLESVPLGPEGSEGWRNEFWKMELMLIEKMLDVDARNFHAWDYRRYVTRSLPDSFKPQRTEEDELRYTQKKIEANFSNFSAWHCRSKLLGSLWEGFSAEEKTKRRNLELELVQQALWTDPGDQSGWLYHRWLIGQEPNVAILRQELTQTKELLEEAPDSRWCMLALVHYSLLLADLTADQSETTALKEESAKTLERLAEIDADRSARYVDMAKGLV